MADKSDSSDKDEIIKRLEGEKKALAEILELSAAGAMDNENTAPPVANTKAVEEAVEEKLSGMKRDFDKKLSAILQQKKDLSVSPQQWNDLLAKFATVDDRLKSLDRITEVEKKITDIEAAKKAAAETKDGLFGDMSAFEENTTASALGNAPAPRSLRTIDLAMRKLDEVMEARFHHYDKRMEEFGQRLSPKALAMLDRLASNGDRIIADIVPKAVDAEIEKIVSAFSFEIRGLSESIKKLAEETERLNTDTKTFLDMVDALEDRMKGLEGRLNEIDRDSRLINSLKREITKGYDTTGDELERLYKNGVLSRSAFEDGMKKITH